MAYCEKIEACPFFNDRLDSIPKIAELMKNFYCRTDNSRCARYKIKTTLGRKYVPADLLPSDMLRAKAIISENCNI
jgi:hypothetical protein